MIDWTDWPIVLGGCFVFALALNAVLWIATKAGDWWRKR